VCYREGDKADVFGLDLRTGAVTNFRKIAGEYNEVEGASPDAKWFAFQSARSSDAAGVGYGIFLYRLNAE
jgi:hypothetical protein